MADKKPNVKTEKNIEREYVIPLREKVRVVPRYKKANKAIKIIKEFLAKHMKVKDRDLNKIKLDKSLNEFIWSRGIKNPPSKIKVKTIKYEKEGIVRVELSEMPDKLKFKRAKEEKREKKASEALSKKKPAEKPKEIEKTEEEKKEAEGKKTEEKEKKSAVVEAGQEIEKAAARKTKHISGGKTKAPKHLQRKALAK